MRKILLVFIFILISKTAFLQDSNKNIYSGGMLILQPGYLITNNGHQNIEHHNFGLGGILRLYFYKYFTVGIYGGTQKANYNTSESTHSYISIGYGGPFLGFSRKSGKLRYTASVFCGISTIRNLHIERQNSNLLTDAYFYKKSRMVISPVLSIDYAVSQRMALTLQTVCLTTKFTGDKSLVNPILQLGVLFNR